MGCAILIGQPRGNLYCFYRSRRSASSAIRELEELAWLDCPRVSHGGKGANLKLISLTDAGWAQLAPHGIQRPPHLVQGGELHDFAARAMQALARQQQESVDFEVPFGPARLDAVWQRANGQKLLINIGVSDPQREADALERVLAETSEQYVHVGINKRFNQGVARRLKQVNPEWTDRVEYRLMGALIKKAFMNKDA